MKNIYEVLRQKENEIQQLQKDIEALRVAARLLADDSSEVDTIRSVASTGTAPRVSVAAGAPTGKAADTLGPAVGIRQFP
jgi:prefoldin subunit 5